MFLTNTGEITRKKKKRNKTPPVPTTFKNRHSKPLHPEIQRYALASRQSKHKSIYLIVSLVSLVSSVPLRDYRPFLIWKTKKNTPIELLLLCLHAATSALAISQNTSFLKSWSSGSHQEWMTWMIWGCLSLPTPGDCEGCISEAMHISLFINVYRNFVLESSQFLAYSPK